MWPLSTVSRRSMQRKAVLLPEPLWPMMATTEPFRTVNDTPSSTRVLPKHLEMLSISTMGDMEFPLEAAAQHRQRIAQDEIERGNDHEDDEGLEGGVVDDLTGTGQLDKADGRGQGGVLDDLHHEAHGGRGGDLDGLRQDHVPDPLMPAQSQALGGLSLGAWHRFDATTPDLAQVGRHIDRQRHRRRRQGRHVQAQCGQAEVGQRQQHQERRALDQLDVERHQQARPTWAIGASQCHRKPEQTATDEGQQRQAYGPYQTIEQKAQMRRIEKAHVVLRNRFRDSSEWGAQAATAWESKAG